MMYLGDQAVGIATSIPIFGDIAKIECGKYTPIEDEIPSNVNIPHSLNSVPDFACYFTDSKIPVSESYEYTYLLSGFIYPINIEWSSLTTDSLKQVFFLKKQQSGASYSNTTANMSSYVNSTYFNFFTANSTDRLKAGTTYNYVIGKFKEVTPNA